VDFSLSPAAQSFRAEVRTFLAEHLTSEIVERAHRTGTIHDWGLHRALAERGWLAAGLPVTAGGQDRDPVELAIFFSELEKAGAPIDGLATTMIVAGVIQQIGTEYQRQTVIPKLLSGEALCCLGYSEPDAGSDVAAATTRAVPDGDEWVIDGQKVFTSLAHEASWVILLTRTNTAVAKHRGLTMFLVPMDTPGIDVAPIWTMGPERTNTTYYHDVRISDRWRLGEVDGGWQVMLVALAYERGVMGGTAKGFPLWEAARDCAAAVGRLDDPVVRERLARLAIDNEVAELLTLRTAWVASTGALPAVEGSITKLFASEAYQRAAESLGDLAGPAGLWRRGPGAALEEARRHAPVVTIYGGTSEIQRNGIAERLLGLPRAR
jgi:alkylation response protein AidB-like acyl-CoA dehydrogenase